MTRAVQGSWFRVNAGFVSTSTAKNLTELTDRAVGAVTRLINYLDKAKAP